MSFRIRYFVFMLFLGSLTLEVFAANFEGVARPDIEYRRMQLPSESIGALGNDLFGEQIDKFSGATSFSVTDISLPGNNDLSVALSRTRAVEETDGYPPIISMGDWEIDVPSLGGVFSKNNGWTVAGANPNARCSQGSGAPIDATTPEGGLFLAKDYWQGYQINIPGMPVQQMLRNNAQTQIRNSTSRWTTTNHWVIECLPTLKNGVAGEGFLAIAPDGTKYYFDRMIVREGEYLLTNIKKLLYSRDTFVADGFCESSVQVTTCYYATQSYGYMNQLDGGGSGSTCSSTNNGAPLVRVSTGWDGGSTSCTTGISGQQHVYAELLRQSMNLVATRVEDRFGNWIAYSYSADDRLTSINSSDGRLIQINYAGESKLPVSAATNGRVWSYTYDAVTNRLTNVTNPDTTGWSYAQTGIEATGRLERFLNPERPFEPCVQNALFGSSSPVVPVYTYIITHPSGAKGEFEFAPRLLGKANAIACDYMAVSLLSLNRKKISGSGLVGGIWQFSYGPDFSSLQSAIDTPRPPHNCTTMQCVTTVNTQITNPDASIETLTFGTKLDENDGLLLSSAVVKNGKKLKRENFTYIFKNPAWKVGDNPKYQYDSVRSEYIRPIKHRLIEQDGVTFNWQVLDFDEFARPTDVSRFSSLGYNKTELYSYEDNKTIWAIGQLASIADVGSGKIQLFRQFYADSALVKSHNEYGRLIGTYLWNIDGTLATATDANNHSVSFSNYFRGVPQRTTYSDDTADIRTVDANGWITAVTDQLGSTKQFTYNSMGRLSSVILPSGDVTAWNPTSSIFSQIGSAEYGLQTGHWRQTVSLGTKKTNAYMDAFWRPVLKEEFDSNDPSTTTRQTIRRYDAMGRLVFESYPITSVEDFNSTVPGINTEYDALGRVTKVTQDSELGPLATTTEYLKGFKTRVTDPKGNQTIVSYQVFDEPDMSRPTLIQQPLSITTTIVRDVFGKPLTTTRSGPK